MAIQQELLGFPSKKSRNAGNLLVRQYWEKDYSRLYALITVPDLEDLEGFVRHITRLIENTT